MSRKKPSVEEKEEENFESGFRADRLLALANLCILQSAP